MSEHLHAVVEDDVVVNVVVLTPEVALELAELDAFGEAELVDLEGLDPVPGIGWTRDGSTWTAPPAPPAPEPVEEPEAADGAPEVESEATP